MTETIVLPAFARLIEMASATEGASVASVKELSERLSKAFGAQLADLAYDMAGAAKYLGAQIDSLATGADATNVWLELRPSARAVLSKVLREPGIHKLAELANELAA